jgi:hypothetical protein
MTMTLGSPHHSLRTPPKRLLPRLEVLEDRALPSVTVWTGASSLQDTNWSDPGNWSNGVPGPADTAEFNSQSAQTQFATVDTPFTIQGILKTKDAGGSITLNAPLLLTGASEWDAGSLVINGPNGGSVTNDGTITSTNGVGISGNGTFTNNGTIIRQGTTDDLGVGGYTNGVGWTVTLVNTSTGVIDFQSDSGLTSGNGSVANAGTIEKTAGTGTSSIFVSVRNTGTIAALSGTIQFIGTDSSDTATSFGTVDTNGTFQTAAGAVIDLASWGALHFVENGTFTATGSGTIRLDAGALDTGPSGATFNVAGTATFLWSDAFINIAPATTLTWNGALSVDAGGDPILAGGGTFIENGTITQSGSGNLTIVPPENQDGVTTLTIASGSTFNFLSDSSLYGNAVSGTDTALLDNAGTIEKTGGTGTSTIETGMMNNSGTVAVSSGTVAMSATGTAPGQVYNLFTNSGSFLIAAGSILQIHNDYTQTSTGSLQPTLAGAGQFGQLQVSGQATLAGTLNVSSPSNFSPTTGQSFPVLTAASVSGTFSALSGLGSPPGMVLSPIYSSTEVVLQASISGSPVITSETPNPQPGVPFSVDVSATDGNGVVQTGYRGTVHFTSSDPQASLPPDYTFTAADQGTHRFVNQTTLRTAGLQGLTVNDVTFPAIATSSVQVGAATRASGIGAFDSASGSWYLRNEDSAGAPDAGQFAYGLPNWEGVVGDWNGDGVVTVGVVNPLGTFATWYLRNENSPGGPDDTGGVPFAFGFTNWIPLVGDWTGSGHTGIGMFDPTSNTFYLENDPGSGKVDFLFQYGAPGWIPIAGDWTGSGHAGIGLVDPATMTWYLRNEVGAGAPDAGQFAYGAPGWKPVAGDWNGDGKTTVGLFAPGTFTWYLRNENNAGAPDAGQFAFGYSTWQPLAGAWSLSAASKATPANAAGAEDLLAAVLAVEPGGVRRTRALDALFSSEA